MDRNETIATQADSLRDLMANRLGLKRGTLAHRAAKAGRRLPIGVRNDIASVARAEAMADNPKLGLRMDPKATHAAYERAAAFLRAIDVKDRRKGVALSILGSVALNILAVIGLLILVLRWRGFV
ncbi:hypothetical protein [Marivita hallyeonensis]|uniref:Uncharacterized protein n=1 Tax=Marivita hallyeonensis TaxID=996342 RepID=A0A1M5NMX4_9RHOB|nr:hypothetical protein [Marivita hallyeonensis]SHG90838.1 hypothetical protein SAMN05443551_0984 [Marivita hallyeonensis]